MKRALKRLLIVLLIGAGGAAVLRAARRDKAVPVGPPAEWPPFEPSATPAKTGAIGAMAEAAEHSHVDHGEHTAPVEHTASAEPTAHEANPAPAHTGAIGAMAVAAEHSHVEHPHTEPSQAPQASQASPASQADSSPDWVAPVDGGCPDGYPIKANDNSRIFHVPGGRFYDRTVPERCYASADAASRDGYRRAKA